MFSKKNLLKAWDVPDPCGTDLWIWNTSVNKIGNAKNFLYHVEGGKCNGINCLV